METIVLLKQASIPDYSHVANLAREALRNAHASKKFGYLWPVTYMLLPFALPEFVSESVYGAEAEYEKNGKQTITVYIEDYPQRTRLEEFVWYPTKLKTGVPWLLKTADRRVSHTVCTAIATETTKYLQRQLGTDRVAFIVGDARVKADVDLPKPWYGNVPSFYYRSDLLEEEGIEFTIIVNHYKGYDLAPRIRFSAVDADLVPDFPDWSVFRKFNLLTLTPKVLFELETLVAEFLQEYLS